MNKSLTWSLLLGLLASVSAGEVTELTPENYEELTAGKTVFIKFLAPWCGHCTKMKPDWQKLADDFSKSTTQLIADVDCTAAGEDLCETHGVQGFPTLKWGDPNDLQEYEGGRDYESLKEFADENLKPQCSPTNLDLCNADKKKEIEQYQAMSVDELETKIQEKEDQLAKLDSDFDKYVEGLQAEYQAKADILAEEQQKIKKSGLGLMKSVMAHIANKDKKDEL